MTVGEVGIGAGTRDVPGRPNVVRLVVGDSAGTVGDAVVIESNVDDLDPRVWPDVLARLMEAGALDAWLTPILAKKGRPAHTLHVLAVPWDEPLLTRLVLTHTSTLGVRRTPVTRSVLDRSWVPVAVLGGEMRVKVGHRDGIVRARDTGVRGRGGARPHRRCPGRRGARAGGGRRGHGRARTRRSVAQGPRDQNAAI